MNSQTTHTTVRTEGFEGVLYPGNGRKDKVMIVMTGSNGGMKLTLQEASFYHKNGFPALALALFRTKETSKDLSRIPVEFAEHAISWLEKQGYERIGVDGMSKGSEMALLAASMFPKLSCVIARVPSHFVSEGLAGSGKNRRPSGTSCWSYRGKELPYAPYRRRSFSLLNELLKEHELHLISFNRDKDVTKETLIPIEMIRGPILFLSSEHDEVWPSFESASLMENHLTMTGFPYPHRHIAFEHISHAMITEIPWIYRMVFKSEREHPKECEQDREQLKKELLNWAESVW